MQFQNRHKRFYFNFYEVRRKIILKMHQAKLEYSLVSQKIIISFQPYLCYCSPLPYFSCLLKTKNLCLCVGVCVHANRESKKHISVRQPKLLTPTNAQKILFWKFLQLKRVSQSIVAQRTQECFEGITFLITQISTKTQGDTFLLKILDANFFSHTKKKKKCDLFRKCLLSITSILGNVYGPTEHSF